MRGKSIIGIYKITNKQNGKVYIGKSTNVTRRWHEHVKHLTAGTHHSCKLQEDFHEFGILAFTFEIILTCEEKDLDIEESIFINEYDSISNGYNIAGVTDEFSFDYITGIKGKFVVDMSGLMNTGIKQSSIFRYLYLYTQVVTTDGQIGKQFGIKKISDLNRYTKMSDGLFRGFIRELKTVGLIVIGEDGGFELSSQYIKKLKEWKVGIQDDNIIIYKDALKQIYTNCDLIQSKMISAIFCISDCLNLNQCSYADLFNKLLEFYAEPRRCMFKWQKIEIDGVPIFKYFDGQCCVSTSIYHSPDVLGNKTTIDNTFKDMKNKTIKR